MKKESRGGIQRVLVILLCFMLVTGNSGTVAFAGESVPAQMDAEEITSSPEGDELMPENDLTDTSDTMEKTADEESSEKEPGEEPSEGEPSAEEHTSGESAEEPAAERNTTEESAAEENTSGESAEEPAAERNTTEESAAEENTTEESAAEEAATEESAAEEATTEKSAEEEPVAGENAEPAQETEYPAFAPEPVEIDGVKISVSAPEGVFPYGAVLSVEKVPAAEQEKADSAVEELRDTEKNVAVSYTFDIKVLAADGTELEPQDASKVKVAFSLAEVADENLETDVYHVTKDETTGEFSAEKLEIITDVTDTADVVSEDPDITVVVETDGFSYYTVEFTYDTLQYVLEGDRSVPLAEILNELGLTGNAEDVEVSDESLFSASDETGEWIVTAHKAFTTSEWMKVTINGVVYDIIVTDDAQSSVSYTEYSWDDTTKTLSTTTRTATQYTVVTKNLIKESSDGTGKGLMSGTYVVNSDTTIDEYFYIRKNQSVDLIVQDGVTLTCKKGIGCGYDKNNEYATLNIYGGGKIVSTGKKKAAGIGGNDGETNGWITIHGTTIEATGGKHGAGIGGGEGGKDPNASSPTIRIYAGDITAKGGIDGAGIGGGDEQPGARTYIYSGTVKASSDKHGAGIGGGDEEGTFGIWICGGKVTATGGHHGAGIGAGEEGGNMRKSPDGGIHIQGGNVTATGAEGAAGIGGGYNENMSGTIDIEGETTIVRATSSYRGAGIGAGSANQSDDFGCEGDMKGTITIACGPESDIYAEGGEQGAGIGAGFGGNMDGTFYMKGGKVVVKGGLWAAGIGGGCELSGVGGLADLGGEGGTAYIGGGDLTTQPGAGYEWEGSFLYWDIEEDSKAEAIGRGHEDRVSGSVYISHDNNETGKYMRVVYNPYQGCSPSIDLTKDHTANAGDRSKKCHTHSKVHITECTHKDHNGKSGLTYTINDDGTHTVKCKYCGYEAKETHTGSDCVCGYSKPNKVITLNSFDGIQVFTVAGGNSFTLPYQTGELVTGNTVPSSYYEVKGWSLSGDTSGKVYEAGSDVTVTSDMEFTLVAKRVYIIEFTDTQNGKISSDLNQAKEGETIQFDAEPDPGYSVSRVSYTYITDYDYQSSSYSYAESVEIPVVDGVYQMPMPSLPEPANGIIVSAEFTKAPNRVFISEGIENGIIYSDKETAEENTTVTITAEPDRGFRLDKIRCRTVSGTEVELTKYSDTEYTFRMPAESVTVSAEFDELSSWEKLQADIDSAGSGDVITLNGDCVADADDTALVIPEGKTITIDLMGFTIDRDLYESTENGNVITNTGTLTITDSSQEKTGMITGGYNDTEGGGIRNTGTLTIEGGIITGNCAKEGGAGIWTNRTLTITGGTITDNISRIGNGGGIYYASGTLNISGSPVITGNTADNDDDDLFIDESCILSITGDLAEDAKIGIREKNLNSGAFTSGLPGKGTAANFVSNDAGCQVGLNADGEAILYTASAVNAKGVTGSFNDRIKLNYYFDFPDDVLADEGAYVTLTNENTGKTITLPVNKAEQVPEKGYKFSIPLAAKEASDTIIAKVFESQGNALTIRGDHSGNDYTETGVRYTLMQYFDWLRNSGESKEEKDLGAAAKDYCIATQIYFNYNADGLAVSGAVDAVTAETLSSYISGRKGTLPTGVSIRGISAMLESDNTFRLYFSLKGVDPGKLTFAIDGGTADLTLRSDGEYYLALGAGVYSNKLQVEHTYSVSDGTNTYAVTASILTYARACAMKSNDLESNLGKALYLYNLAAIARFGE